MPTRSRFASLAALAILTTAPAFGQEETPWQFHGFVGQRLTLTDHNNFFGRTEKRLSTDVAELGINGSWQAHPAWLLSAQAISRRAGDSETGKIGFDYAFVGWTPIYDDDCRLNVKLGRIKVPYGLMNESRDTPGTRSGIVPPQGIYLDALRAFNQTAQGAALEAVQVAGDGEFTLNWMRGKPTTTDRNAEWVMFGRDRPGDIAGEDAHLVRLLYDHRGGRLRLALTEGQGAIVYRPGPADFIRDGRTTFLHRIVSMQYNTEYWTLTFENNRSRIDTVLNDLKADARDRTHWYLEGRYRFAPRWEALLRYDRSMDDRAATDDWTKTSIDRMLGIRYRPDARWLLAGELHAVDGVSWLPPLDNLKNGVFDPHALTRRWNLLMFQVSYQF